MAAQQFAQVKAAVEPLLRVSPRDLDLLALSARAHLGLGHHVQALAVCERGCAAGGNAELLFLRGDARRNLGRTDEALADFAKAARLDPQMIEAPLGAVAALEEAGRTADARAALTALTESLKATGRPLSPKCMFEDAKLLVQEKRYADAIAAIDELLRVIPPGFRQRRMTLRLRVKACDRSGDFAGAWEAARQLAADEQVSFDPAAYTRQTDALIAYWSPERMRGAARAQDRDPTAIFIAGMPRSGTSLLEQIIASHPDGAGVGELATLEVFAAEADAALGIAGQAVGGARDVGERRYTRAARDYLAQVRTLHPRAARIVNKSLFNDRMAAHLSLLFPATRIVHIQRDPRDVAVSCMLGGFNLKRLPWTARPDWAAHAWAESARLMRHWAQALDVPLLDVRYEELVQSGVPAFRRVIEFVGLPWDDSVTQFHTAQRTVQTLSYDQVNKPLYTSAIARWRHYESWLAGMSWPNYG